MTPSIYFIVLVLVLGTLALGWSFYRRQQFKRAPEPGCTSRSVSLPGKRVTALRTRLCCALVALSFAGLTLLLGPQPHALAAVSHPLTNKGCCLVVNQYLSNDDYLSSCYGYDCYFALMQDDGNFVLYKGTGPTDNHGAIWATGTGGHPNSAFFAILQSDNNFCIYKGTSPSDNHGVIWCTGSVNKVGKQTFAAIPSCCGEGDFYLSSGTPSNSGLIYWSALHGHI